MRRTFGFLVVAFVALLLVSAKGAKFWETKDYTQWDERECKDVLTKSPWAFSSTFDQLSQIGVRSGIPNTGNPTGAQAGAGSTLGGRNERRTTFEFRLLSAKPIRMALARLQMLENPQVTQTKDPVEKYVNSDPGKEIVVQISVRTKPAADAGVMLASGFSRATLADFQGTTFLINGKKQFVAPTSYIQVSEKNPLPAFVFPRFAPDGAPYFTKDDKSITFRTELTGLRYSVYWKFNPKQMVFKDGFEM